MNYYTASSNMDLWPNKLQDKINTYNILKWSQCVNINMRWWFELSGSRSVWGLARHLSQRLNPIGKLSIGHVCDKKDEDEVNKKGFWKSESIIGQQSRLSMSLAATHPTHLPHTLLIHFSFVRWSHCCPTVAARLNTPATDGATGNPSFLTITI